MFFIFFSFYPLVNTLLSQQSLLSFENALKVVLFYLTKIIYISLSGLTPFGQTIIKWHVIMFCNGSSI